MQKHIKYLSILGAALAVVLLAGCTQTAIDTDTTSSTATAVVEVDPNVVVDAPEECPSKTTVVVESDEAGVVEMTTANSYFLHWRDDAGQIVFANYDVDPTNIYDDISGNNVLTVLKVSHVDESELAVGMYDKSEILNQALGELNISTVDLAGGVFDDLAILDIVYMDDEYVCGTIISDDGYSSINGEFIAQYVDQRI